MNLTEIWKELEGEGRVNKILVKDKIRILESIN